MTTSSWTDIGKMKSQRQKTRRMQMREMTGKDMRCDAQCWTARLSIVRLFATKGAAGHV